MRLISFLLRYSKGTVTLAVLVGIVSGISSALLMALINLKLSSFNQPSPTGMLVWKFIGLALVMLVSSLISRIILNHLSERATFELRMTLCQQVLATPLRKLEETGTHKILAALTQDINVITSALLSVPVLCINLTVMIGCLIYLGWISPTVLLISLVFFALSVLSVEMVQKRALRSLKAARDEWDKLVNHFRALTDGTKELKLHRRRRESFLSEFVESTARSFRQHESVGRHLYSVAVSWTQILYFIFIGMVLFALPLFQDVSLHTLTSYILTILFMKAPIGALLDIVPFIKRANISLKKVEELGLSLARYTGQETGAGDSEQKLSGVTIDMVGVTHTFYQEREDRNFALGPLDLTLSEGELVFLIGGNGSGKTTFAKVLTGLYPPESGQIWMNGEPVTDENRDFYRQQFSTVFSDFYLFEKLLGLDNPNLDTEAQEYLRKFQLDHKVEVKNGSFSTVDLSRGQRKRLALLTAYLEDRPVYVFDEWAADQDYLFREFFYLHLLPQLKARGKTVIVISHDDKYFHIADRIIKLDYGQLVVSDYLFYVPDASAQAPSTAN